MNAHPEVIRQVLARGAQSSGSSAVVEAEAEPPKRGWVIRIGSGDLYHFCPKAEGWGVSEKRSVEYMFPRQTRRVEVVGSARESAGSGGSDLFEEALQMIASNPDYTIEGFHRVVSRRK